MANSLLQNIFGKRYTVGELMNIDQGRQGRAGNCSVSLVNTYFSLKEEGIAAKFAQLFGGNTLKVCYITLKLKVKSDTGNSHFVFIQLEPDFSLNDWSNNQVRVYCDCADFKYRSAYLLDKRDSLFANDWIKLTLGQALTDKPDGKKGTTLLCKHVYAVLQWLMTNYDNVMGAL